MIVVCKECNTSFNLEDGRIKPSGSKVRCSRCDNIFMVFPFFESPVYESPAAEMIFEETSGESGKDKDLFPAEDFDFSEFDKMDKGEGLPKEEELNLSEFDKIFEEKFPSAGDAAESQDLDSELSDTEDMDFSDIEKMLEVDIREEMSEKKLDESASDDTGDLDLSELENIIDNLGEEGIEEAEGEPEELKFDIEPAQEEIVSKIDDMDEVDFSDLEKMLESDNDEKTLEKQEKSDLKFDLQATPAGKKDDDVGDLDLSELDKIISSLDESEPAGALEKEPEETLDLDFSDFESVLADETTGVEKTGDKEQALELKFDSVPEEAGTSEKRPDDLDLDFSEVEKMLEMEGKTDLSVQKVGEESLELEPAAAEPSEKPQQADEWAETIVTGKDGLGLAEKEPEEEEHAHMEEYALAKFNKTIEEPETAVAAAEPGEKTAEPEKERKSLKVGKPPGKFLSILAVIVIITAGAGAFVVYNPFGIEIPFISDFIGSKADEKGTLRIIPADDSIKGDFVQTRIGSLFVITGKVKNEYKHPRSYISVTGKLFKKGKALLKAETVYCGNVIPENEIGASDPALMKKRLQNRFGDKKSNVKVQPGGIVPFMIIFENVTYELDEFSVEAAGSIKE